MEGQPLIEPELAGNRHVHIEVSGTPQAVMTGVPIRSYRVGGVKIGIQVLVQQAVRRTGVCRGGGNIGPIVTDTGKRIVLSACRVYRQSTLVAHQRRDIPVAEEMGQQAAAPKLAYIDHAGVEE